jgi:hypothetical protein
MQIQPCQFKGIKKEGGTREGGRREKKELALAFHVQFPNL